MPIEGISNRYRPDTSGWDALPPVDAKSLTQPIAPVKTREDRYYKDSITSAAETATAPVAQKSSQSIWQKGNSLVSALNTTVTWIYDFFRGKNASPLSQEKPLLEPPEYIDERARQRFIDDTIALQDHLQELNDEFANLIKSNPKKAEALLTKLIIMMVKTQAKHKEDDGVLSAKSIQTHQKRISAQSSTSLKNLEELEKFYNRSAFAGTVSTGLGVAAGVATLATLALTLTLPHAAGAMVAINALVKGADIGLSATYIGSTLWKGYNDVSLDKLKADSILLQAQKELAQEGVKVGLDEVKQAMESISNMWQLLKDISDQQLQTALLMLRK